MSVTFIEGVVEEGQIRLNSEVSLPDETKVYIVVPDIEIEEIKVHLGSPRFARPERTKDFEMEVIVATS